MANIEEVNVGKFNELAVKKLKSVKEIKSPEWAAFVKTGTNRARQPVEKDWWFARTASILRKVAVRGPIGVQKLRTIYGGKKNRGYKPEKFFKASGSIIRKSMQQLTAAGLIEDGKVGVRKGKVLTAKGRKFVKEIMDEIKKSKK